MRNEIANNVTLLMYLLFITICRSTAWLDYFLSSFTGGTRHVPSSASGFGQYRRMIM